MKLKQVCENIAILYKFGNNFIKYLRMGCFTISVWDRKTLLTSEKIITFVKFGSSMGLKLKKVLLNHMNLKQ